MTLSEALRAVGHEIVFDSGDPTSFLELAGTRHIDLALLDIHLGGSVTGIDVGYKLRAVYPSTALLFITSFSDPRLMPGGSRKIPEGASYVEKAKIQSIEFLKKEIDVALSGNQQTKSSLTGLSSLTDNQVEVLRMVAEGLSNQQIADRTATSVKNIEGVISRIIKSLGLQDATNQNQRVHMARVYFRSRGVRLDD